MSGTVVSKYLMSCFTSEGFLKTSTVNLHLYVRELRHRVQVICPRSHKRQVQFECLSLHLPSFITSALCTCCGVFSTLWSNPCIPSENCKHKLWECQPELWSDLGFVSTTVERGPGTRSIDSNVTELACYGISFIVICSSWKVDTSKRGSGTCL